MKWRLLFLLVIQPIHGMWMPPVVDRVPVQRVLTNLTVRLSKDTNNFELLHAIARLHSLSYANAASNWVVEVETNRPSKNPNLRQWVSPGASNQLPFWGHGMEATLPPRTITKTQTKEAESAAQKHLSEAIKFYSRALLVNPTNQVSAIGLGWCQLQAGQTNEAKVTLRRAIKLAWDREKTRQSTWGTTFTEEAISYLEPLLDPVKDKAELLSLAKIKSETAKFGRMVTPLALALETNLTASDLINPTASIEFDLDGSAVPGRRWQWINTNAAWIVHLPGGGEVTSALQMFGNVTFWLFWKNGYHALASLDDNADGQLTGPELRDIFLWQDLNTDGKSTPDEILPLDRLGIISLGTRYTDQNGIPSSAQGATFQDGSTRPTFDLILHSVPGSGGDGDAYHQLKR